MHVQCMYVWMDIGRTAWDVCISKHICIINTNLHAVVNTYMHPYAHIYIHMHTYIHMDMHVCMYPCIHTYIQNAILGNVPFKEVIH